MSATTVQPNRSARTRVLADLGVMTWRNLLRLVRLPNLLLLSTLLPVVFMLMFTYVFGGAIERTMPAAAGGK